jgi:hypothetical protein
MQNHYDNKVSGEEGKSGEGGEERGTGRAGAETLKEELTDLPEL